jgi:hypothetical protein
MAIWRISRGNDDWQPATVVDKLMWGTVNTSERVIGESPHEAGAQGQGVVSAQVADEGHGDGEIRDANDIK